MADHDNNASTYYETDQLITQISLYGGRSMLIESQGPCWFCGTGSEHTILYQYETYNAKNIYLGHIQTESPYWQPAPVAPEPFNATGRLFPGDPDFSLCLGDTCKEAWGLRIISSENILVYSAGLYSWFSDYVQQPCLSEEDCQQSIFEVKGSENVAIFNMFTKGVQEVATSGGYIIEQEDTQMGFTTEVSVFFPENSLPEVCYIGTKVHDTLKMQCPSPAVVVIEPSPLPSPIVISPGPYKTSLEVGSTTTTITVQPNPFTLDKVPFSNINITGGVTNGVVFQTFASVDLDPVTVTLTAAQTTSTRILTLPPWPQITNGPSDTWSTPTDRILNQTATPPGQPPQVIEEPPPTDDNVEKYLEDDDKDPVWAFWRKCLMKEIIACFGD